MTATKRVDSPLLGIGFFVSNLLTMVLIGGLVKLLSGEYAIAQILFFRYLFAVIPLFFLAVSTQGVASLKTTRYRDHTIRTISGIVALGLFFYSLSLIPFAEANMLAYSSPIFITILSIPILSEAIGVRRWSAVLIGFVGVILIAQPGSEVFSLGGIAALASAALAAFVTIWLRLLSDTESPTTTAVIYNTTGSLLFALSLFYFGWVPIDNLTDWVLLISVGLIASFQQFCLATSFRYGEASLLAPFEYLVLVFAVLLGYFVWNEVPPLMSVLGGILISVSGLIILARKRRKDGL